MVFGIVPECRSASLRMSVQLCRNPQAAHGGFSALPERSSKSPAPPTSHSASTPSTKPFTCYSSSVTTAPVRRLAPTLRSALRHETDPDCRLESRRRHEQSPGARRSLGPIERDPRFRQVEGLPFLSGTAHRGTSRHSLPTPTDYHCVRSSLGARLESDLFAHIHCLNMGVLPFVCRVFICPARQPREVCVPSGILCLGTSHQNRNRRRNWRCRGARRRGSPSGDSSSR